ncbi:sulfotransferase domain-containing protein [Glaciecola sp. KUL10]|uniref:sulfotransferase domain-containing protein n=1 Tax=Glaciecola sp. (strain KUL10) TaxID=2161813 RepID=UPI000D788E06|nr:sulfotransferase domain-containing protein [Glaciecola sp. KUL10]
MATSQSSEFVDSECKAILHIGMPKTGSSAIQKFCLENEAWLLEHGFYYPFHSLDANGISGGHSDLYHLLIEKKYSDAKTLLQFYLNEADKNNKTLLLSNEGSHLLHKEFKKICDELPLRVVGFYRHPVDNLFSSYNQMVKRHFLKESLLEYTEKSVRAKKPILSGKSLLDWSTEFKDQVTILPYDSSISGKNSAIHQFLTFLGISEEAIESRLTKKRINSSYTADYLELKRLLNYVLSSEDEALNSHIDLFFQQQSDNSQLPSRKVQDALPVALVKQLYAKFKQDIERIQTLHNFSFDADNQMTKTSQSSPFEDLKAQIELIENIKLREPSLYKKVKNAIVRKNWGVINADKQKLLSLFDVPLHQVKYYEDAFFDKKELNKILEYKQVDVYREFASLLYKRGDLKSAYGFIVKAEDIRPNGPVIKELKQKIEKAIKQR